MLLGCDLRPSDSVRVAPNAGAGTGAVSPPEDLAVGTRDCTASAGQGPPLGGRARRLTRLELENSLSDLMGSGDGVEVLVSSLEPDASALGYSTGDQRGVSSNYVDALKDIAEHLTANLRQAPESQALEATCWSDEVGAAACARHFIHDFGARALRRPLAQDELDELFAVYQLGRATATDDEPASALWAGLDYAARALLQSSSFIFRTELGVPDAGATSVPLTPFETAAVLSYGLTASPPDAELTLQAANNALVTPAQVMAQGRRLLAEYPARYARLAERFVREWLGIDLDSPAWDKSPTLYPAANHAFKVALDNETGLFLREWASSSSFDELLNTPRGFVSHDDAWVYGFSDASPVPTAADFDPHQRAGVLTLPSVLGSLAHEGTSSPVLRGLAVMKKFLCLQGPPVPAMVPPLPAVDHDAAVSTRARYAQHTSSPVCAGCHATFDPMGFTFEHYDAVGRYRDEDNGVAVDSHGALVDGASPVAQVADVIELSSLLAASPHVHACFVHQVYRFAFGRLEAESDACVLDATHKLFGEQNLNVRELMLALVTNLALAPRSPAAPEL